MQTRKSSKTDKRIGATILAASAFVGIAEFAGAVTGGAYLFGKTLETLFTHSASEPEQKLVFSALAYLLFRPVMKNWVVPGVKVGIRMLGVKMPWEKHGPKQLKLPFPEA